jgi:predicted dienelactone hydrolase
MTHLRPTRPRAGHTAVAALLLLLVASCGRSSGGSEPAPDPLQPGLYPVGVTTVTFFDPARDRPLRTEIWYPADESVRDLPPSPITDFVDASLAPLLVDSTVPLVGVRDVAVSPDGPFPLVAFSHGNGGIRFQNTFQCERLASHGFIVVAPDHTGNTLLDLGGDPNSAENRPLDISFLYDEMSRQTDEPGSPYEGWVDVDRPFGVTGHSFGSFTSMAVASTDPRVGAALPMAAPGPISTAYSAPTFLMLATEDKTIGLELNAAIRSAWDALPGPRWLAQIIDAGHFSFTIACLTGTGLGDGDGCGESERFGDGAPFAFTPSELVWEIVDGYSVALFGRYLKGIEEYESVLEENIAPDVVELLSDPRPESVTFAEPGAIATAPGAVPTSRHRIKDYPEPP